MARLEDMESFVRVVEAGNISRAAERMGVAKSAVSRRLSDLEERLGAQLFRRTTRTMNLTDTGRSYYERCVRILEDIEEAEHAVSQAHGTLQGRLKVAAPLSFGLRHLAPLISEFRHRHPRVEFELDFNDRQVDLITEGFDLAVRIADLPDSSLIARRLWISRTLICASPDYLDAHGWPRSPEDLVEHDCLIYSNVPDPTSWTCQTPEGSTVRVEVAPAMVANNGDFLAGVAARGHGVVRSPSFIVHDYIRQGTLVPLLTEYAWPVLTAYAVYPRTRHLSQRVRAFVDFLAQHFEGTPYWDTRVQSRNEAPGPD